MKKLSKLNKFSKNKNLKKKTSKRRKNKSKLFRQSGGSGSGSGHGTGTSGSFSSSTSIQPGKKKIVLDGVPPNLKRGYRVVFGKGTPKEETRIVEGGGKKKTKKKVGGGNELILSQPLSHYHAPGTTIHFEKRRDPMEYYFGKPKKRENITEDDCPEHKSFKDDTHMQELGFVKPFACRQDTLDQNKVEYYSNPNKGKGFLCEHPYPQTLEKCKQNNWYRATREENMDGFCDKCSAIPGSSIMHYGYNDDEETAGSKYPTAQLRQISEEDIRSINRLLAKPCYGTELYMFNHLPEVREEGQCVRVDNTNNRLNAYNFPYINAPTCSAMRDDLIDAAKGKKGYLFTNLENCNEEARLRVCRNKSLPIVDAVKKGKLICPDSALVAASRTDVARCKANGKDESYCETTFGKPALDAAKSKRDSLRNAVVSGLIH